MIFVTVGNWYKGFDRLVKAVDELRENGVIIEEVTAQIGAGKYKPKHLTTIDYCSPNDFDRYVDLARVIIAHSGVGTISHAVKLKIPVIVVPRKASLGEHFNDHQFATAKVLEAESKVLVAYDTDEIAEKLKEAEQFVPASIGNGGEIVSVVEEFIAKLAAKKMQR